MSFLASASWIRTHALRARPEMGLMRTSVRSDIWDVQQNGLLRVRFVISRHVVKRLIAILVVLIPFAQGRAEQLPIRTYTTADGLPRDSIHKIVPDPRGYLWFCTSDGLSRFDGYEFVNYGTAHGLPHRLVYDLLITRNGDYWAATAGGLAHFNARSE